MAKAHPMPRSLRGKLGGLTHAANHTKEEHQVAMAHARAALDARFPNAAARRLYYVRLAASAAAARHARADRQHPKPIPADLAPYQRDPTQPVND